MKRICLGVSLSLLCAAGVADAATKVSQALTIAPITPITPIETENPVVEWQNQYNATAATIPFRIPLDMPVTAPLVPGQLVTAKYAPFAGTVAVTQNDAFGLLFPILTNAQLVFNEGPSTVPVANTAPQDPYENDGDAATSCSEYVYKKYYDYRRFQDAAATCGGNPDCIYQLWATTTTPSGHVMAPRSGVATVMSPYPTSTLDPNPYQSSQTGSWQQVKNPFRDPNTVSWFQRAIEDAVTSEELAGTTAAAQLETAYDDVGNYLVSSAFTSSSPYYSMTGSRAPWHVQMHDQQQSYGENMLDRKIIEQRIANMETLLNAFAIAVNSDLQFAEQWERETEAACGGLVTPIICTPQMPCKTPPPPSPECLALRDHPPTNQAEYEASIPLANALVAEYNNIDRVTGAVDNGCLGVTHNKCDWSPEMIGQEYLTTLDAQVAADTSFCDGTIGSNAASILGEQQADAEQDEVYFAQALAAVKAGAAQVRAELNWLSSGSNTIHYDLFGGPSSWTIGGSFAGASYSQNAYWEVKGEELNSTLCRISGRVVGSANSTATVFGQQATLLDADVNLGVGEMAATAVDYAGYDVESHLTVAGYSVYSFPEQTQSGNLDDTLLNQQYSDQVLDIPGQISWVSLNLAVNVTAGVSATLTATAPGPCTAQSNLSNDAYSLGVNITPSVGAQAVGTALVGALGTGVGIQGTVDVITATLPLTVTTGIGGSGDSLALALDANASLDLTVLAGQLDVAECVVGDCATQELFSWAGIPAFHQTLWNMTDSFPLVDMQTAFNL